MSRNAHDTTPPGPDRVDGAGVVMFQSTLAAAWNLQGDPATSSIVAQVDRLFAVSLPLEPNTTRRDGPLIVFWLGPRSWLLVEANANGHPGRLTDFDARRDLLNAAGGALFDVSASRIAYTLRGANAANVLARSCPLDFDQRSFAPGACAQSLLGRMAALYYRHAATAAFTVMVARSLGADAWHGLGVAAASDGVQTMASRPFSAD